MGSTTSKEYEPRVSEEIVDEKAAYRKDTNIEAKMRGLALSPANNESSELSVDSLSGWEADLLSDPKNRLAQTALAKNPITAIINTTKVDQSLQDQYFFNVEVETIGSPSYYDNQKSSGRCWIFAASNVLRSHVIKNYNLKPDGFQLSQSYLYFYDKLEKANYFLENIIDTAEEPLDSRLIQYLLSAPVNDGGQWDLIINLVNKYGVVPQEVFPDNAQAVSSSGFNHVLTEKLREYALILRKLINEGASNKEIYDAKNTFNKEIYNITALSLGTPPKPTDSFTWEFIDKNGKYNYFETNAKDFYANHVKFDASKQFSLVNDPRNDFNKLYTVERLNNVYEGKPIEYINTSSNTLKKIAIKQLKDNEPIFFGSDVGKFSDRDSGILDTNAYSYKLGFGTDFKLTKLERLQTGSSAMTHAMVITGVHLDPKTQKPVRWKIENSWGDAVGDKGYFLMTDDWFDEYVFQIVTNKKYTDKDLYDVYKKKDFVTLPFYDPLGALA
ncbi:peptidase C1B, bleomycin hydrolase [Hyphopichia burtonii NRRL Y-1933]|uniref:Cysteine proteinase 1, mitochondrial n=1 Tax=Hyphopichia burtonii NRRL Y-1933 TaxID=984485 RepID=A0A1E4RSL4_9ASCO|nr:peptidase C1B, bleomycin hydrolase [Hyphopichia burtonii NRRL Y-1933]ODV70171.1 peptidase C1B, bleomycin hydrolase [Hyphopichia burtonii NRRL Y-1933]